MSELAALLRAAVLDAKSVGFEGFGRFVPTTIGRVRTLTFRTAPALKAALLGGPAPTVDPRVAEVVAGLLAGEEVQVEGAGSFRVKSRRAFRGVDPKTGEPMDVPEARLVLFRIAPSLRAEANAGPDPLAAPGQLRLDRHAGRNLVLRPRPGAPAGADLLEALGDPRIGSVSRLTVIGATDGDAERVAALAPELAELELLDGGVSDRGAAALAAATWPRLRRLELHGNAIGVEGLDALAVVPGLDPGVQQPPFGSPSLFPEQLHLPWEDLDPLLDGWGERLVLSVADVLEQEGLDASPLLTVRHRPEPDRRWPSLPGPDLRVRWRGWLRATDRLSIPDSPRGRAIGRLVGAARAALDGLVAGGLEGAYGNDFGWAVGLGHAVALAEGTTCRWSTGDVPAVVPDVNVLAELRAEVDALHG